MLFTLIDLTFSLAAGFVVGLTVKQFGMGASLDVGVDLVFWRVVYFQVPLQITALAIIHGIGRHKYVGWCLAGVMCSVIIAFSMFVQSIVDGVFSLVPYFYSGMYNEGFVIMLTACFSWLALKFSGAIQMQASAEAD